MKKIISLSLVMMLVLSLFAFAGCKPSEADKGNEQAGSESSSDINTDNPVATISVKDYGDITVELYYDVAPNTVENFISLANKGFYDGLTFHRVVSGFMIQGGCPDGNGTGDPGYSIKGEFDINGFENKLAHSRGVISMARSSMPDSAGSQFFIMHQDSPHLDGQYAAFGMVIDGMDVVDAIAAAEVTLNIGASEFSTPVEKIIIESITVDIGSVTYEEPETILNNF